MSRQINLTINLNDDEIKALENAGYTQDSSIKEMITNTIHDILASEIENTVETNIGVMSKEDYDQYVLEQYGFSSRDELEHESLEIEFGDEARQRELGLENMCSNQPVSIDEPESRFSFVGLAADYLTARGFKAESDYLFQYGENYDKFIEYNIIEADSKAVFIKAKDKSSDFISSLYISTNELNALKNGNKHFGEVVRDKYEEYQEGIKDLEDVEHLIKRYYDTGELECSYKEWSFYRIRDVLNGIKYYGYEIIKNNERKALIRYVPEGELYSADSGNISVGGFHRLETNSDYISEGVKTTFNSFTLLRIEHTGKLYSDEVSSRINETYNIAKKKIIKAFGFSSQTAKWIDKADIIEVKKSLYEAANISDEFSEPLSNPVMKYYRDNDTGYNDYLHREDFPKMSRDKWENAERKAQIEWANSSFEKLSVYKAAAALLGKYKIKIPELKLPVEALALIREDKLIKETEICPCRESVLMDAENAILKNSDYSFRYDTDNGRYIDYEVVQVRNDEIDLGFSQGDYNFPDMQTENELMTIKKKDFKSLDIGMALNDYINPFKNMALNKSGKE